MSSLNLSLESIPSLRHAVWVRLLLSHRILNGLSVGVGLGTMGVLVYLVAGPLAAASVSVGMLILSIGDQVAPARGKLRQIAPLLYMAGPTTLAVQLGLLVPDHSTAVIGVLVCLGGFIGMLGTAWGLRGGPLGFALLLAIVFAMSTPPSERWQDAFRHAALFQVGALLYSAWAVLSARLLNLRYRTQALADALNELATMLRAQAARLAATGDRRENQLRALLGEQAALADKLQTARDLVLDLPESPAELRLAGMLIAAIRVREQALACELELDMQPGRGIPPMSARQADALERLWGDFAAYLDRVCWSLYTGGKLTGDLARTLQSRIDTASEETQEALRSAVEAMQGDMRRLLGLAEHGSDEPHVASTLDARDFPKFRTSMRWPIAPLKRAMSGHSPVLRYAVRVAITLGVGYVIGLHLPWAAHPQWILLTIAVVMRTNLAQTIERRNARLIGTLIGCVLVTAILSLAPPVPLQFVVLAFAAAIAHGFAQVRYLVAATAATVLALVQGHVLHTAGGFALYERLADTLIGTALAWLFSYVLPAWEQRQMPALLVRLRAALAQHARVTLGATDLASASADWRLARREVHDCLAAIALAAQRAQFEPRKVQPPLELLERVQLRSYRVMAQLGGVRVWREQPQASSDTAVPPLLEAHLRRILTALERDVSGSAAADATVEASSETLALHAGTATLHRRLLEAQRESKALGVELREALVWVARPGRASSR